VGYGDGYPRGAKAGTPVLVRGVRVPVIGRVSMDLMTLDLRGLPDAAVGDSVVLWGADLPVKRSPRQPGRSATNSPVSITAACVSSKPEQRRVDWHMVVPTRTRAIAFAAGA
jgi:alanine racemase